MELQCVMVLEVMIPCQTKMVLLPRSRSYSKCSYIAAPLVLNTPDTVLLYSGASVHESHFLDLFHCRGRNIPKVSF